MPSFAISKLTEFLNLHPDQLQNLTISCPRAYFFEIFHQNASATFWVLLLTDKLINWGNNITSLVEEICEIQTSVMDVQNVANQQLQIPHLTTALKAEISAHSILSVSLVPHIQGGSK